MAGPLKLAKKYQADSLRERIVSYLETIWPTNLKDWDEVVHVTAKPNLSEKTSFEPPTDEDSPTVDLCPDSAPFIKLARESDVPKILATVFYTLCCDSKTRRRDLSCMTREDLERFMLGKERMTKFICRQAALDHNLKPWESARVHLCDIDEQPTSKAYQLHVFKAWLDIVRDSIRSGDPLAIIRTKSLECQRLTEDEFYAPNDVGQEQFCTPCGERMVIILEKIREELFSKLPFFFDLEDRSLQE